MIAGIEISVGGSPIDPKLAALLAEVVVDDHLMLPDAFTIKISDPGLAHIDTHPFEVGAEVAIQMASSESHSLSLLIDGQITSVEPTFGKSGAVIVVRGYDYSHALNRTRRTETYQNATAGDIAQKVAHRAGLDVGEIANDGGVQDFVQQNNETDWQFLWRLAQRVGAEVVVIGRTLHFRASGGGAHRPPHNMRWGEDLIDFRPRLTGVQQVDDVVVTGWDPAKKEVIEATARADAIDTTIGTGRPSVVGALSGGTIRMATNPVASREEAEALAKSVADRVGNAYLEASGEARGNPKLRAGTTVKVDGLGDRFGGTYTLASTTHVYRGGVGYKTRFAISGRSERSLVELLTPASPKGWGSSVAIGVVTQNKDPDGMGRVRVRYPELGDSAEGWWARVTSLGAGADKGMLMMPTVGDEVLVAFEHDDVRRPYILGSVWNGKDKPKDLVHDDGSLAIRSQKRVRVDSVDEIGIESGREVGVTVGDAKITLTQSGEVHVQAANVRITATESLEIEAGNAISIQAGGVVTISGSQVLIG